MTSNSPTNPETALLAQLTELNNRSRWYSSQLWQIPFAYLGLTVVMLAALHDACAGTRAIASIASALIGICVLFHTHKIKGGEKRAINNLRAVEVILLDDKKLKTLLDGIKVEVAPDAKEGNKVLEVPSVTPHTYELPLTVMVAGAALVYLVCGLVYFLCR